MKQYGFLIFIFIFISCGKMETSLTDNVKQMEIDVDDRRIFNYSQLFDTCFVIPLETRDNALVGEVKKVILVDKYLILLDNNTSKSIFIYDLDGKLRNIIDRQGEGPGEYIFPFAIYLSELGREVIVFDSKGLKAIFYTLEGEFVREVKLGQNGVFFDLFPMEGSFYLTGEDPANEKKILKEVNQDFELQKTIDTFSPDDIWMINGTKQKYIFEKAGGKGFYYMAWGAKRILEIVDNHIEQEIRFSFSRDGFQSKAGEPLTFGEYGTRMDAEETFALGDQIIDGKNFMFIDVHQNRFVKMALWDKATDKIHYISYLNNDMDGMITKMPGMFGFNFNSGYFITMMYPPDFNERAKKGIPESPYKDLLENIKLEDIDNPVLFVYTFKEYFDE
ncbi:6-bladed beta-propeller [Lunatimonas salinarum]|uniref:6-bladed beta-propeller n=1 Tax=Lunatimonas salinarum TaxID=1774590 RepID=UPI001ADEBFE8|nr:6-bladed beta-propeller [Lunatimonas salinarum]